MCSLDLAVNNLDYRNLLVDTENLHPKYTYSRAHVIAMPALDRVRVYSREKKTQSCEHTTLIICSSSLGLFPSFLFLSPSRSYEQGAAAAAAAAAAARAIGGFM